MFVASQQAEQWLFLYFVSFLLQLVVVDVIGRHANLMPVYSLRAWAIDESSPLDPAFHHDDNFLSVVPHLLRFASSPSLGFHVRACLHQTSPDMEPITELLVVEEQFVVGLVNMLLT